MAGGDNLNEFPKSTHRVAGDRSCRHEGCAGATETKYHHIGACLEPRMVAIRGAFAAKYGIEMTGGAFLPQQVIQIMSHDSATWRVKLSTTETEEAVQADACTQRILDAAIIKLGSCSTALNSNPLRCPPLCQQSVGPFLTQGPHARRGDP